LVTVGNPLLGNWSCSGGNTIHSNHREVVFNEIYGYIVHDIGERAYDFEDNQGIRHLQWRLCKTVISPRSPAIQASAPITPVQLRASMFISQHPAAVATLIEIYSHVYPYKALLCQNLMVILLHHRRV
jgi:hypothetical protein